MPLPREVPEILLKPVAAAFHVVFYRNRRRTWASLNWLGVPILKCPFDLFMYQELVSELRPDVIVETGTFQGGSALYFASLCVLLGHGRVVSIDTDPAAGRPEHPRIEYITGSSTSPDVVERVRKATNLAETVFVVLDSDHAESHVARELELYSPLVTRGSYLIVEDTNVNGHPVYRRHGPGPMEAVQKFLRLHPEFTVDPSRERLYLTFNPGGYLRRVS